jgi:hypothetical protein
VTVVDDELAGIDDDHDDGDGPVDDREPGADGARYVCDVDGCGATFDKASSLGLHKFRTHGIKGARRNAGNRKSSSGGDAAPRNRSTKNAGTSTTRSRLIRESVLEVLDTRRAFRGEGTDDLDVEGTLRRDVDRIANALASLAERDVFSFLGPIIDRTLGAGGPVSIFRAFAPTLRSLVTHRRDARLEQEREQQAFDAHYATLLANEGQAAADDFAERYRRGEIRFE